MTQPALKAKGRPAPAAPRAEPVITEVASHLLPYALRPVVTAIWRALAARGFTEAVPNSPAALHNPATGQVISAHDGIGETTILFTDTRTRIVFGAFVFATLIDDRTRVCVRSSGTIAAIGDAMAGVWAQCYADALLEAAAPTDNPPDA
jgi:hypothetical protein